MEYNYYKTVSYTALPSTNIFKLESLIREDKLLNNIFPNTLAVIFPELKLIWYEREWLSFFFPKEELKEIITGIKENDKIEMNNY